MRRWRDSVLAVGIVNDRPEPFGSVDMTITPEEAVTAAGFLNAFVALLTLVRLGDLPIDPRTPIRKFVSRARRAPAGDRIGPSCR